MLMWPIVKMSLTPLQRQSCGSLQFPVRWPGTSSQAEPALCSDRSTEAESMQPHTAQTNNLIGRATRTNCSFVVLLSHQNEMLLPNSSSSFPSCDKLLSYNTVFQRSNQPRVPSGWCVCVCDCTFSPLTIYEIKSMTAKTVVNVNLVELHSTINQCWSVSTASIIINRNMKEVLSI